MIPSPTLPWRRILTRSAKVAAVVGLVLNIINQPEALTGEADLVVWKVLLTFCVPFCVSTHGSVTALRAFAADRK